MRGGKIIAGVVAAALVGLVGFGVWASRKTKAEKEADLWNVQPIYGPNMPLGMSPMNTGDVPSSAIEAVKKVHGKFVLHEAYDGPDGMYLVETHEGFDPLVFRVRRK
jgi:hypothetical protein